VHGLAVQVDLPVGGRVFSLSMLPGHGNPNYTDSGTRP
jgi:hypothetical protein